MSRRSPFSLLLITTITIVAVILFSSPLTVRSDQSFLRLPSSSIADESSSICGESVASLGSCPVKCFRPVPVCGVDNVTYWCGCAEAFCAGTRVAKLGFCELENGGSGPVSGQALLLVHIVWLILLGFFVLFGLL